MSTFSTSAFKSYQDISPVPVMGVPISNTTSATAPVVLATPYASSVSTTNNNTTPNTNTQQQPQVVKPLSQKQIRRLQDLGFTQSLAMSMNDVKNKFAQRIWIVDNSGSMNQTDGHRIIHDVDTKRQVRMVECTRWQEIRSCVEYHMRLASLIQAPTQFRLLNPSFGTPNEFSLGHGSQDDQEAFSFEAEDAIRSLGKVQPNGSTPLTAHIRRIRAEVVAQQDALRRSGQQVAIIIATDGLPTDERGYGGEIHQQQFVEALRMLEGLPVWVVIRLCTDEDAVVNFYNDIDAVLELSIDVLDDFTAEAKEIYEFNPWINYALPLHRIREFGHHDRLLDLIDERPFTRSEIRDYCTLLYGNMDGVPDPSVQWKVFLDHVNRLNKNESDRFNPLKKRPKPWISIKKLGRRNRIFC